MKTQRFALLMFVTLSTASAAIGLEKGGHARLGPPTRVEAKIDFVDTGSALMVSGRARGMAPGSVYASLIYDVGAAPDGPGACVPTIFDPTDPRFIVGRMFLGFWEVDEAGRGTLTAVNTNGGIDYVPLDRIGAVSVRRLLGTTVDDPTDLEACAAVRRIGNDEL